VNFAWLGDFWSRTETLLQELVTILAEFQAEQLVACVTIKEVPVWCHEPLLWTYRVRVCSQAYVPLGVANSKSNTMSTATVNGSSIHFASSDVADNVWWRSVRVKQIWSDSDRSLLRCSRLLSTLCRKLIFLLKCQKCYIFYKTGLEGVDRFSNERVIHDALLVLTPCPKKTNQFQWKNIDS